MRLRGLIPVFSGKKESKPSSIHQDYKDKARLKVSSSLIKSVGYDENNLLLDVEFTNKKINRYINVTKDTFDKMLKAPSIGFYFLQNIDNNYPTRLIRVKKTRMSIL